MSNACKIGELSQLKIKESPTLMDLYTEMNRLKLENEILKANNYELEMVNEQLRNDVELLHNRLNGNNQYDTVVDGNEDLSYVDEYAKGFEMIKDNYKIVSITN